MTTNQTRLELIAEGSYIRMIATWQCKICDKIFTDLKLIKEHQTKHTEEEFTKTL